MMKSVLLSAFLLVVLVACSDRDETPDTIPDQCQLVPDPGPCKAMIKKYYYDKTENRCKEFTWGGCDGVVPFDTLEDCKQCEQSKVSG